MSNGNTGFIVGNNGTLFKTSDGGNTWISINSGTTDDLLNVHFINENEGWAAGLISGGSGGVILKTIDGGNTWAKLDTSITNISSVFFIDSLNGWICNNSIYHSSDGGKSWSIQITGKFTKVVFLDSLNGFALGISGSSSAHLYLTHDGGSNWLPSTMDKGSLQDMQFLNKDTGYVVGFYGRIFRTTDAGMTWTRQPSYCNRYLFSVDFTDANNGWVVGSAGTVLHTTNGGATLVNNNYVNNNFPNQFILYQNYPNPFNPTTTINYYLPKSRIVSIKVYNILGSEITTLVNGEKSAGSYSINFNASNYASGIYFYQMKAGNFIETKKIILLK